MNVLFTASEAVERSGGLKMRPGIYSAALFNGVTKEGTWYDVNYGNSDGQVIHKRLFKPEPTNPKDGEKPEDTIRRKGFQNMVHLTHLVKLFLGPEVLNSIKGDYFSVMDSLMGMLNSQKGRKVNLKVIPDSDGVYSDLPFSPSNYVELHEPDVEPTLKFNKTELERFKVPAASGGGPVTGGNVNV